MMNLRLLFLVFVGLAFLAPLSAARADDVVIDLAVDHIDITTGFNGSYLSLFGVQSGEGDIAITIRGPRRAMVVRQKKKILGVWMNRKGMEFDAVPVYYDYALSKPEAEIAPEDVRRAHYIGTETLRFSSQDEKDLSAENVKVFQDALIRNKVATGLFSSVPQPVTYIDDRFFRATLYLPANVPTGLYTIETYLIKGGRVKDVRTTEVMVAQVGRSAAIYHFAHSWAFIYGLLCVCFAVGVGWLSNYIRRRLSSV